MSSSNSRLVIDLEVKRKQAILWLLLGIIVFFILEAPRGDHWFDKIKYNYSIWAYANSLVLFMAGEAALLVAALLAYYRRIAMPVLRSWNWIAWVGAGLAFTWLSADKMLALHERMADMLIQSVPALHSASPSLVDGSILFVYGIFAAAFGIAFIKGPMITPHARSYFLWGFALMFVAVGHDVLENFYDPRFIDGELIEKLAQIFSAWAFTAAFLTTAATLCARVLHEFDIQAVLARPEPVEAEVQAVPEEDDKPVTGSM